MPTALGGQGTPLPDSVILDADEVGAIRDHVAGYNLAIQRHLLGGGDPGPRRERDPAGTSRPTAGTSAGVDLTRDYPDGRHLQLRRRPPDGPGLRGRWPTSGSRRSTKAGEPSARRPGSRSWASASQARRAPRPDRVQRRGLPEPAGGLPAPRPAIEAPAGSGRRLALGRRRRPRRGDPRGAPSSCLGRAPTRCSTTWPALEDQQRGDRADVVAPGHLGALVDVELADLHPTRVLLGQGVDEGGDHAARERTIPPRSPRGPGPSTGEPRSPSSRCSRRRSCRSRRHLPRVTPSILHRSDGLLLLAEAEDRVEGPVDDAHDEPAQDRRPAGRSRGSPG